MLMHERIAELWSRIQKIKQRQKVLTKVQTFRFRPFSAKQKQVLTWWMPDSPVKDVVRQIK